MDEDWLAIKNYSGVTRLFPLPSLVFFPHALQPLHIFENRYRDMMADALAGDRLISLVLLRPGWEADYDGRPSVEPFACLGRIVTHELLPDGRYNLLLRGLGRVHISEELNTDNTFRTAKADLVVEESAGNSADRLRKELVQAVEPNENLVRLVSSDLSLSVVCDVLGFTLNLPLPCKQSLLATPEVSCRVRTLIDAIQPKRPFPPKFSVN